MIDTIESVALSLTVALLPVGILLLIMHVRMLRVLRVQHSDVWVSLGSPRLWFARTSAETSETLGFLWRRDYRALGNSQFSMLCGVVRALHLSFVSLFVVAAILFLVVAFQRLGFAA